MNVSEIGSRGVRRRLGRIGLSCVAFVMVVQASPAAAQSDESWVPR